MIFVTLAVAVGLLAGDTAYTRYKMYVDWQEYRPEQYQVTVDKDGLLVFEYASDGRHGYRGYGYGFDNENGVFYNTPHISSWPQVFGPVEATNADAFRDIRLGDEKLVYVESITIDEQVFDEASGRYQWKEASFFIGAVKALERFRFSRAFLHDAKNSQKTNQMHPAFVSRVKVLSAGGIGGQ
jgi:hypothetical protein